MKKTVILFFALLTFSLVYSQNKYNSIDSIVVFYGNGSSFYREYLNISSLNEECFKVQKREKEYSIYFDSKGYDNIEASIGNIIIVDSIYKTNSVYHKKIFESNFNTHPIKKKVLKVNLRDQLRKFQIEINNNYNSIIIIPHVDEQLITGFKQEKSDILGDEILEKSTDYIEIHLLDFDYYDFVIAKKECGW